ncbi:hypothetical protein Salat_1493400 [Sesamum alatum]|uniref:DUF4283 domain-containing protein n=1 Tax=Sesamum alatum TaxID=300844 RepID=A0AAE1YBU7_9LAMI|nr:hypothetical protein Salat_1493400 [Sesamum alatum]
MADGMDNLSEALSLSEEKNQSILLPPNLGQNVSELQRFFLVGKLLGRRSFNFEAFKNTMLNAFNPGRGLEFHLIEDDQILFQFNHILDRRRVIEGGLWAFDKNLLVLPSVEPNAIPSRVELNWTDFHIHVHDLPLNCMTKEVATFIGNQLGIFRDVDMDKGGQGWGSSL